MRERILAGLLCVIAIAAAAAEPAAPAIDLVTEVQQARGNTEAEERIVCMDCDSFVFFEEFSCGVEGDPERVPIQYKRDTFDPCPRSSCTSFTSDLAR